MVSFLSKDPADRLKRIQVLVVDNDDAIIELLKSVLETLGFGTVLSARDGFEALQLMRSKKVDLLITDWELNANTESDASRMIPDDPNAPAPTNGSKFLKFIRGSKASPNPYLAIIMMTGQALRENVAYARDSGVNEILVKPVSAESLCSRIRTVIENERPFVTANSYKGPCRRRRPVALVEGQAERRITDIRIIKYG